jgi:hypothetical protein
MLDATERPAPGAFWPGNPYFAPAHVIRGTVYVSAGRLDEAIAEYTAAINIMDGMRGQLATPCWYYDRGIARLQNGDQAGADADFTAGDAVLAQAPMTSVEMVRARGLYCRGVAKLKVGDQSGRAEWMLRRRLRPTSSQTCSGCTAWRASSPERIAIGLNRKTL